MRPAFNGKIYSTVSVNVRKIES